MAGPLGEMFDHGCDAINTTLEVILGLRALNLTRSWWTVASVAATAANFYLTTWEEFHTGTLYLGVFSGPVDGILIIVAIYIISGIYGTTVWNAPLLSLPILSTLTTYESLAKIVPLSIRELPINVAFMIFSAIGLGFNIATSYGNVYKSLKKNDSVIAPIIRLLPFCLSAGLHVLFLASPLRGPDGALGGGRTVTHSALLMPYMCFWGLEFAHQVGRMITAHVTKTSFPYWDNMWVWIALGAIDGHAETLFGRSPLIQSSPDAQTAFVLVSLALSILSYGRFCVLVIKDITEYLGIACFTVRKKDKDGEWKHVWEIEDIKVQ